MYARDMTRVAGELKGSDLREFVRQRKAESCRWEDIMEMRKREGVYVGWLDRLHPIVTFADDLILHAFLDALFRACVQSVAYTRGYHNCPFCNCSETVKAVRLGTELCLGSPEIHVGQGDTLFVAPNLIYHYVERHRYLPPQPFQEAIIHRYGARLKTNDDH